MPFDISRSNHFLAMPSSWPHLEDKQLLGNRGEEGTCWKSPVLGHKEICTGLGVSLGEVNVEKSARGGGERKRGLTLKGPACHKGLEFSGWARESLKEFTRGSCTASVTW